MTKAIINPTKLFVISLLALLFILVAYAASFAGEAAGTVTHISGPLFAKKADGTTRVLSKDSTVESGDVIVSEKSTYARIKFTDGSEMTLRPDTQIKITNYSYDQAKPQEDAAVYDLAKGGLRAITGAVGKRGNKDSYKMNTPTATVGIRGTVYECRLCEGNCGQVPNGLYLFVATGAIAATNSGGSQHINAGQYAYVASPSAKPVILPGNPGINFTLPPSMTSASGQSKGGNKSGDCTVR